MWFDVLHEGPVPAERITLICIGEYPGIGHFWGAGRTRCGSAARAADHSGVRTAHSRRSRIGHPCMVGRAGGTAGGTRQAGLAALERAAVPRRGLRPAQPRVSLDPRRAVPDRTAHRHRSHHRRRSCYCRRTSPSAPGVLACSPAGIASVSRRHVESRRHGPADPGTHALMIAEPPGTPVGANTALRLSEACTCPGRTLHGVSTKAPRRLGRPGSFRGTLLVFR